MTWRRWLLAGALLVFVTVLAGGVYVAQVDDNHTHGAQGYTHEEAPVVLRAITTMFPDRGPAWVGCANTYALDHFPPGRWPSNDEVSIRLSAACEGKR